MDEEPVPKHYKLTHDSNNVNEITGQPNMNQKLAKQCSSIHWQNAIFLPFDTFFANVVLLSVILVVFLVIYKIAYSAQKTMYVLEKYITPLCDIIYLTDTLLKILHNLLKKIQETRGYMPTSWPSLIIDIISLIPLNLIFDTWVIKKHGSWQGIGNVLSSNKLMRIYRLQLNFLQLRSAIGVRNLWYLTMGYVTLYLVFGHILAALLHTMSCWGCKEINWTHSFPSTVLDYSETMNQFIAAVTVILSLNWNNAAGNISATVPREWVFFSFAMVTGLIMKSVFYAYLVGILKRNMWRQLSFMLEMRSEAKFIDSWGTSDTLYDQVSLYHMTLLENRAAIQTVPEFFHALPRPLQRSVQLDIHWEVLRHSQLFQNEDISFKRALSCVMRIQYYLPGEYVFKANRYTSEMIYVTSGVLQILTEDDAETPVLSLSSGTTLGEGTLLTPSKCHADIRSATHSELHILDATSLYRLLNLYPIAATHLHEKRVARFLIAKHLKTLRHREIERQGIRQHNNGMGWLKICWHMIEDTTKHCGDQVSPNFSVPILETRTSCHLELLALSDRVELISNAICLDMSCPCVLEPKSNFLNWWGKFVILMSFIIILLYPYYITFTTTFPNWLLITDTVFVITSVIDLFIQSSTAIKLENQPMIVDTGHLLRLKLQTTGFIVDTIVALPIELFITIFGSVSSNSINLDNYSCSIYRANRLFTVYRLYKYMVQFEEHMGRKVEPVKLCWSIFMYVITAYWMATVIYLTSCRLKACGVNTLIGYYGTLEAESLAKEGLLYNVLISSMYYTFNIITSLGISKKVPRNKWEVLELDAGIIFSLMIYVYFCAESGATHIIKYETNNAAAEHLSLVTQFLTQHGNSMNLITCIRNHFHAQWIYNKFRRHTNGKLLSMVCQDLYDKIIIQSIMENLKSSLIFSEGNQVFLEILAKKAQVFLFTKDAIIAKAGLKTTTMYVIRNGYCQVISALPSDVDRDRKETVGPGSAMLVIEFVRNTNNLADICALTACEILSIQHSDFRQTLNMFPEYKAQLARAINQCDDLADRTLVSFKNEKKSISTINGYPKLASLDEKAIDLQYIKPFKRIGVLSIIRYLMLRRGMDPCGKYFTSWEELREVVCFMSIIFYPQFFTSLVAYPQLRWAGYLFDLIGFIDIYLRLHLSYFTNNGIRVSHPLLTAKHYIAGCLFVDILTSLPLELFGLENTLGSSNTHLTKAWFYLITRPFLLFRIFGRFVITNNEIEHRNTSLAGLRFLLIIGIMLNSFSCANMLYICQFQYKDDVYENIECTTYSWFSVSRFKQHNNPLAIYCISVYFYSTFIFRCGNGAISTVTTEEMVVVMLVCITVIPMWWLTVAQITCSKIGCDLSLTGYRQEIRSLLRYLKAEDVSMELITVIIDEVEHCWKCSKKSTDCKNLFETLPPHLREEVAMELNGSVLARVDLFRDHDLNAIRLLANQFDNTCYRKGSPIICRNEVQDKIYIVKDGFVDVLAADDSLICTIGPGGIFGSFRKTKPLRHTMQMMAQGHVLLLSIAGSKFYSTIDNFPVVQARLSCATIVNIEFIVDSVMVPKYAEKKSNAGSIQTKAYSSMTFISKELAWYKWFCWILCLPVSMMSVYLVTTQIAMHALNVPMNFLIYLCDLLFFIKIFIGFHTNLIDQSKDVAITNYERVSRRYIYSWDLFWLDLLCCIPFEILSRVVSIPKFRTQLYTILKSNRLLRIFHLLKFQANGQKDLYVSPVKRIFYFCTTNLVVVHLGVCLWIFVACREFGCSHNIPPNRQKHFVTSRIEAMMLAYQYNSDLLTSVGSHDVQPSTVPEALTTLLLIVLYQAVVLNFLTTVATMIHFTQYIFTNFEIQAERLYSFMKSRSLSPVLLQRIWDYYLQQWVRYRGAWMPSMISSMPAFLRHRIMFDIYGYLLIESEVFHGLHDDFLFQLAARMKCCVYFPKNYIVQAGDVNHTMYFIHSGKVEVLSKPQSTIQGSGSIFGIQQGVTNYLPHSNDVVALTVSVVMSLQKIAWKDLLEEYPSVEIILLERISRLSKDY
ncbi:uncharacterized protein LOC105687418 [Athalia rosae]|uniref:uncharacterized protein LOC105687418 n=1 Tax=Athalia rosae TaxID=37344 RepID=UPI002033F072|nr:uncharacterized protein LOC105687418 [Athalia rosae]